VATVAAENRPAAATRNRARAERVGAGCSRVGASDVERGARKGNEPRGSTRGLDDDGGAFATGRHEHLGANDGRVRALDRPRRRRARALLEVGIGVPERARREGGEEDGQEKRRHDGRQRPGTDQASAWRWRWGFEHGTPNNALDVGRELLGSRKNHEGRSYRDVTKGLGPVGTLRPRPGAPTAGRGAPATGRRRIPGTASPTDAAAPSS
jgi:hypothetical protein